MTQSPRATEIPTQIGLTNRPLIQTAIDRPGFSLTLCSRIRGRERWHVDGLKGNRQLAAAVETVLRGESGVEEAVVNPLTGRVLVRYLPDQIQVSVEMLIRQALALDLMIAEKLIEQELSPPVTSNAFFLPKGLLAAELGCTLLKVLLLGGISCPAGGIWCVAGVIVTLRFAVQQRCVVPVRGGHRAVVNQSR
jgi:heavy-metal-associated domain-containing protein